MSDPSYHDQLALTAYLLQDLEQRVACRGKSECIDYMPSDRYHLGVLGPLDATGSTLTQVGSDTDSQNGDVHVQEGQLAPSALAAARRAVVASVNRGMNMGRGVRVDG
jgi:hypothetical protein